MYKVFAAAVLLTLGGCAGSQMDLPNWAPINASRFPTEISSIAFASGYAIGRTSGVTLPNGSWTVRFAAGGSVEATNPSNGQLNIAPLSCFNSVAAGGQPCYLSLVHTPGEYPICHLIIGTLPEESRSSSSSINISCPDLWTPPS